MLSEDGRSLERNNDSESEMRSGDDMISCGIKFEFGNESK
jgi:hypothetical protein